MTVTAMLLVAVSTLLHVTWNLRSKQRYASGPAFFAVTCLGAAAALPALLLTGAPLHNIPRAVWIILPCTGLAQMLYYAGLSGAYRRSDVGFAYPVIRSLPVLFVPALTAAWGLASPSSALAWVGFALITVGVLLMPFHRLREVSVRAYLKPHCYAALLAAAGTTAYSILDAEALAHLRGEPGWTNAQAAVTFVILQALCANLWLGLAVAASPAARREAWRTMRQHTGHAMVTGAMIYLAYGLILAAFAHAANVGYIVAFRQLSVPLTALAGVVLLKEGCSRLRLAALALVTAGLICVAVG